MKPEDIKEDRLFKNMCRRKQLSKYTKDLYINALTEYCTLTNKTPTELRKEAYNEQLTIPDKLSRSINEYLADFTELLESRGLMNSSIKLKITMIRAFYNEYDIDLPKSTKFKRDKMVKKGSDIVTMEHIRKAVNSTPNFKYKSIITLLCSSGIRSHDLRLLTIQDFIDATKDYHNETDILNVIHSLEGQQIIPCWDFYSEKTDMATITFNTPECTEYIITYLKQRENLKNDQYLFSADGKNPYSVYSRNGVRDMFKRINKRLNFGVLPNGFGFFRAHKLRAFFASTLSNHGVPYAVYKKMMGQRLSDVDNAYIRVDRATCKREYERCLKDLSTEKVEVKTYTSKEIRELVTKMNKQDKKFELVEKLLAEHPELLKKALED